MDTHNPLVRSRLGEQPVDLDPRSRPKDLLGIDPDPRRALKWQPLVVVLLGLGFGIGALLGSARIGLVIGVVLTGLFVAWREVLSERRQVELDDRWAESGGSIEIRCPAIPAS